MRSFLLHIICIVALFSSCDWVNDDLSDCPTGTWLKISYTYNILNVDAASTQVGDITILAFDKNDKYVDRLDVDSITLHQGYCMVRLPFPEETYHLLIWGGISGYQYQLPNLKAGQTERKSLNISLACDNKNQFNRKLNALFHSSLENITISEEYQVITAGLVKNTNYFSCILQDENTLPLRQEDFAFTLESHQRCNRLYKYSCRHNSDLLSSISTGTVSDFRTNPHHSRQIKYTAHHEGRRHNIINKTYTKRENYSAPTTHPIFIVIKKLS